MAAQGAKVGRNSRRAEASVARTVRRGTFTGPREGLQVPPGVTASLLGARHCARGSQTSQGSHTLTSRASGQTKRRVDDMGVLELTLPSGRGGPPA